MKSIALLAGATFLLAGCGQAQAKKEVWRLAIEEPTGSVQDAFAVAFERRVEEATDGEVDVVLYRIGALGTTDDVTEQVHMGALQLAVLSPGYLGKLIPELQVFLLHYALPSDEEVSRERLRAPETRALLSELYAEKGLHFVDVFSEGWQVWTTQTPIREPADFEGVKFRVMTTPLLVAAYNAYGADPTPLPYGEVYGGLQLGMIDGQVNPIFAIEEMSFYEVTDYLIFARQAEFWTTVAANPDFYSGLSQERQRVLDDVLVSLRTEIDETQRAYNRERLDTILEARPEVEVIHLTDEEIALFREASRPVREAFVESTGPRAAELLRLLSATGER